MWGIRGLLSSILRRPRFIPTYVGHTSSFRPKYVLIAVHPHVCGAYLLRSVISVSLLGSSPRMWGIRIKLKFIKLIKRFIPTYVGHTPRMGTARRFKPVHPHVCGAYAITRLKAAFDTGSSPRMWGILTIGTYALKTQRFIPTYVGHTTALTVPIEKPNGSSPRMWGIRFRVPGRCPVLRFIPTYVGHTLFPQMH